MPDDIVLAYWPGWVSGLVLSALIVAYFWITGRLLSSSGRVSVVIDRARHGAEPECDASPEELADALRLATIEAFGANAVHANRASEDAAPAPKRLSVRPRAALSWVGHLSFLIGMALGGRVSHLGAPLKWTLGEGVWAGIVPESALPYLLLLAGVLVGFGTRMAAGCPIGHGLCGMPRGQAGSWAAALAFFGAGVGVSFLLGAL
jgi:uncharacterized membrane protein YedE/YeeE